MKKVMMEERQEETNNSVPQEIIFQLLKELPAKSLLRFRCVSKLWCSIIEDPLFITSHRARSHTRHGGITILMLAKPLSYRYSPDQNVTHFFSINPQGMDMDPPRPLQTLPCIHDVSCVQFVNGLVCFNNNVWNPSTREIITLPPPPITCELLSNHTPWTLSRYCLLGFAPNTNEYKVLQLCQTYATKGHEITNATWRVQCRILTLGLGANSLWRNFDFDFDFDYCLPIQLGNSLIMNVCCVNGTIYCLGQNDHHGKILAFDVEHEKFRCISLLDDTSFQVKLIQVGECLALIDTNVDKVWMLDESLGGNWKRETLIIPEIYKSSSPWRMLTPIGSIHRGDEILLHQWKVEGEDEISFNPWEEGVGRKKFSELFNYEFKNKSFRRICSISHLPGLPDSFIIEPFQISFRKQVECLFRLKGCNVSSQKNK